MKSNHLTLERAPIERLKAPRPVTRVHSQKQLETMCAVLKGLGQLPIPVTPQYELIDGELVLQAAIANGASHVDVVVVHDKTSAEYKALRLALNRVGEETRWDEEGLRSVLEELNAEGFDLELTGFTPPEIDVRLNDDLPQANVEENGSDVPPLEDIPVSASGSLWELGPHRLGCGDAADQAFVGRVLDGRPAQVIFADPPYNLKIQGFISGRGRHRHREFVQGAGELSSEDFVKFLCGMFAVFAVTAAPGALIYCCIDWRHVTELNVAARLAGLTLYNICVWTKSNAGMGGIYRNAHEFVCVYETGHGQPLDNVKLGKHGRNRTNVWAYPGMSSFGKDRDALLGLHPTVKPVAMISDVLRDVTKRGGLVLDTFLGSGSTLMAAQETGRVCCGVELDPRYVDVAIRRWQNATGRDAISVESGETFNAMASRRVAALPSPADDQ